MKKRAPRDRKAPKHRLPTPFSWEEFGIVTLCTYGLCLAATIFARWTQGARTSNDIIITDYQLLELAIAEITVGTVLWIYLARRGWQVGHFRMGFSVVGTLKGIVLLMVGVMICSSFHVLALALPAVHQAVSQASYTMQLTLPVVLIVSMVNPVFEEMLHLGYVQQRLVARGPVVAIGVSTLLRALMHAHRGALALVDVVPIGILFGCVFWFGRRQLFPIIVAHALLDFMALAGMIRWG